MRHHQADVEPDPLLDIARALRVEIGRAAAVGIDQHRRDALREDRLAVLQRLGRESAAGVRVDVDEPGCEREAARHRSPWRRSLRSASRPRQCDRP